MKFLELIWFCKQNEASNQASISINSCSELSKTQLFSVVKTLREKFFFFFVFWYQHFRSSWEKQHLGKWKKDQNHSAFLFLKTFKYFYEVKNIVNFNMLTVTFFLHFLKIYHRLCSISKKVSIHILELVCEILTLTQ